MLPSKFVSSQTSAMRKSRLEGKPSLLPKPRRPGSTDRLSTEARRPSTTGHRSSSAEPRSTFGGGRLSREASATKLPINGRSRSQQGDRFAQSSMTPLRSSQYSNRPTTTPVRTPSDDLASRSWQTSLDRALAFVTIKDQRPISNVAWQRAEVARVSERLAARGGGGFGAGGMTLIRPLTIARFVEITGALLAAITRDVKLNTDNYVTKLPHVLKRLLYPGTVSKSWLKTVNTLHAFPHALALLAYLLDLLAHIETPVSDEWLYVGKDELAFLRRDYLYKCWIRFQDPGHQFEDLNAEYLEKLRALLGNDEEKIAELKQVIKKYEACLEDEVDHSERQEEARRAARRDALCAALRAQRAAARDQRAASAHQLTLKKDYEEASRQLDLEIERANVESQQLSAEVAQQGLSVAERARLLDEVEYAGRVHDSKRALAASIAKMVRSKETELAQWQKRTLDSCVQYKQALIHLAAHQPALADLAFDEKELMKADCVNWVSGAVEALRECSVALAERRAEQARSKTALARKRAALLEETRTKIAEIKVNIDHEQRALDEEGREEARAAAAAAAALRELTGRAAQLQRHVPDYEAKERELLYWEEQEKAWRTKLSSMREYIAAQRRESTEALEAARASRLQLLVDKVRQWQHKLQD